MGSPRFQGTKVSRFFYSDNQTTQTAPRFNFFAFKILADLSLHPAPDASFLARALLAWYPRHRRDLPWRHTRDPYAIWLSEVILQQTRVAQGRPYFETFRAAYPTVHDLAAAPEAEVLRHWQGLGYYSRARNMHRTAPASS